MWQINKRETRREVYKVTEAIKDSQKIFTLFIWLCGISSWSMWTQLQHVGASSWTRDWTWAPWTRNTESQPLDHQRRSPENIKKEDYDKTFPRIVSRRRQWHPTPVLLPWKSHGWRSLEGCSPWDRWGSDTKERLHFHFSLSCIGEGNGNPLQCSCLENTRDRGAWWAAVSGVAQSRTRLKWLSSIA